MTLEWASFFLWVKTLFQPVAVATFQRVYHHSHLTLSNSKLDYSHVKTYSFYCPGGPDGLKSKAQPFCSEAFISLLPCSDSPSFLTWWGANKWGHWHLPLKSGHHHAHVNTASGSVGGRRLWALAHHSSEAQILCTKGLDSQLITPRTRRAPSQRGSHWPLHRWAMLWDAEGSSCLRTHWNVFLVKQKGGEALGLKREARMLLPQQKWLYKGRILHDSGSNSQIAGIFFLHIFTHAGSIHEHILKTNEHKHIQLLLPSLSFFYFMPNWHPWGYIYFYLKLKKNFIVVKLCLF